MTEAADRSVGKQGLIVTGRLYTLDGMRGVAAICVALFHCVTIGAPIMKAGDLAVDFFFMLSGLVIALTYEAKLRDGLGLLAFTTTRLIRLWPLYLVGSMIGLGAIVWGKPLNEYFLSGWPAALQALPFALIMLPDFAARLPYPANGPAWSLMFELLINVAFAGLLFRLRSRTLALIALVALTGFAWQVKVIHNFNLGTIWAHTLGGAFRVTLEFLIGVVIARKVTLRRRSTTWWLLAAVASLLVVLDLSPSRYFDLALVMTVFPAILVAASRFELPRPAAPVCHFLGDLSYPLYAIHIPILCFWAAFVSPLRLPLPIKVVGFLLFSCLIAWSLIGWDTRVRRWLNLRAGLHGRGARTAESAPARL